MGSGREEQKMAGSKAVVRHPTNAAMYEERVGQRAGNLRARLSRVHRGNPSGDGRWQPALAPPTEPAAAVTDTARPKHGPRHRRSRLASVHAGGCASADGTHPTAAGHRRSRRPAAALPPLRRGISNTHVRTPSRRAHWPPTAACQLHRELRERGDRRLPAPAQGRGTGLRCGSSRAHERRGRRDAPLEDRCNCNGNINVCRQIAA